MLSSVSGIDEWYAPLAFFVILDMGELKFINLMSNTVNVKREVHTKFCEVK
jgi:hypothetical protein